LLDVTDGDAAVGQEERAVETVVNAGSGPSLFCV
jgi:hypothetical protein